MENLMLIESRWNWLVAPSRHIDPLKMCECGRRKSIMEHNGQRWCKPCAIESGEYGDDDFE